MSTAFDDSDELLAAYLAETGRAAEASGEAPRRLWEDGREVGEWTVTGFLARGGSGEVYCAKHRRLGKRAALKVLWREEAGPRERFELETRFLMGNPGPSFPAFYGAGVEDGRPWVAMELLDECPAPATDRQVARYLLEVGAGVAAMHARGWLHRDLKFRNILRRADGHAVLADFGLLKAVGTGDAASDVASERESPSVVDGREAGVGTPGFAAPEQFAGGGATAASDVYALGILAEECFGGRPPRAWEKIIRRATAALPRQRYPGVEPMLRAIRRRHRARNWAWALLVALCAALLAVALSRAMRGERPEEIARVAEPESETPIETANPPEELSLQEPRKPDTEPPTEPILPANATAVEAELEGDAEPLTVPANPKPEEVPAPAVQTESGSMPRDGESEPVASAEPTSRKGEKKGHLLGRPKYVVPAAKPEPAPLEAEESRNPLFAKARAAAKAGNINFFGFYTGMPMSDAEALAAHYGLEIQEDTFQENPETHEIYEMRFSLEDVRLITNGPDDFKDLVQVVSKQARTSRNRKQDYWTEWRQEYTFIAANGVWLTMHEFGCTIDDPHRRREADDAIARVRHREIEMWRNRSLLSDPTYEPDVPRLIGEMD